MAGKGKVHAVAYLRTSSATNVGSDKDSERRQRAAIEAYAKAAGIIIVDSYYDEAVSGADQVTARPGFAAMLERIQSNGVRTIIVETANRFARDLIVQETGYAMLAERGIRLIAADSPDSFLDDTPTATLIRQVLGAVSQFEKAMLVSKLKGARDRKRVDNTGNAVKVEGRKSHAEKVPEMVALAKKLHRYRVNGRRRSLRDIAAELSKQGYTPAELTKQGYKGYAGKEGKPFAAQSVARMIAA